MQRMGHPCLIGESHVAPPVPILVTATIHERDPTALDVCAGVFVREFSRRTGAIRYGQFGCVCEPHHTPTR
jgi:hypothetical protein